MSAAAELRGLVTVLVAALTVVAITATASAATADADFQVFITAGATLQAPVISNGGTGNITGLSFKAGAIVDNNGGEEATARIRFTLADGLHFGTDGPDPTESCTASVSGAECQTALTIGTDPMRRTSGWLWDVVADRPGSYVLRVEITQTSVTDPDLSSNTASATVVITEATPAANVSASAARLTPAKPKAGSVVAATVRVTADGILVRPARITCAGSIAGAKLKGTGRAGSGTATCRYRTPRAAKGKTLRGAVAFTARGKRFTKRFSAKLR